MESASEIVPCETGFRDLRRYFPALEQSPCSIIITDLRGRIEYANPACHRVTGYTRDELIGQNPRILQSGEHPSEFYQELWATILSGAEWRGEFLNRKKDGSLYWESASIAPVTDTDGQITHFIAVKEDITQRKTTEERLRRSRESLRTILQALPIPYVIIASDKSIRQLNTAAARLMGYESPEGLIGRPCHEVLCPAETDCCPVLDLRRPIDRAEKLLATKTGRQIPVLKSVVPVRLDDEEVLLEVFVDISEQKELEAANEALRKANDRAEAATRAKSAFLANMSHEIRTPMTAILGYARLLLGEEGIERAPRHRVQAFEVIRRNGEHLLELINDILDLSKVEAGRLEIVRSSCSPWQLVADVMSLMQVRADERGVQFTSEFVGAVPAAMESDPARLRQILVNLVANAIKFTDQGKVSLVTRFLGKEDPPAIQFEVNDTGIGMTEEQMAMLFQPFSQVDPGAARKYGGSGLGLAICKRLAEALGGQVSVRSVPGEGSTFTLTLSMASSGEDAPTASVVQAAPEPAPKPATVPQGIKTLRARVLLAEDSPDIQQLTILLLEEAGAQVQAVANGQLAVEHAHAAWQEGHPFDVVLMDMQMPVLDGYSATRRLRDLGYPGPIVALTAHAMAEDRQRCLDAGCQDYFAKPIDVDRLTARIAELTTASEKVNVAPQDNAPLEASPDRPAVLHSLYANRPVVARLLGDFIACLEPRVQAMQAELQKGALDEVRRLAHQFKGSAGSYGYPALVNAAKTLELHVQRGQLEAAEQAMTSIASLCVAAAQGWQPHA